MSTFNQRSMHDGERAKQVETAWPQTEVLRGFRAASPYRRKRLTWGGLLDFACWVVIWFAFAAGVGWLAARSIAGLARMWS
jgi:hypothetical protein